MARDLKVKHLVAAVVMLALATAACTASGTPDAEGWIEVGSVDDVADRGVVYLEDENVFVVATDEGILGLVGDAQHVEDDRVLYCASSDGFEGPRHGERFDRNGRYRGGPGGVDMDRVQVRVQGAMVSVNPSMVIVATARSEEASPAIGPQCLGVEKPAGFFETG